MGHFILGVTIPLHMNNILNMSELLTSSPSGYTELKLVI